MNFGENGAFWVFFFFFFEFRPESSVSAVSADTGRFRPESSRIGSRRRASKPYRLASARVGENHVGSTWPDAAGRAGSGVPCASPRPASSDAGAAPPVPRPCFPGFSLHLICRTITDLQSFYLHAGTHFLFCRCNNSGQWFSLHLICRNLSISMRVLIFYFASATPDSVLVYI